MNILKLSPVLLSAFLLAAHFFRIGNDAIVWICICFPLLLFVKRKWTVHLIRLFLLTGSIEWFRTLYFSVDNRIQQNESWLRLAIILGAVAIFTALSALVFRFKTIRKIYGFNTYPESVDISNKGVTSSD